MMKSRAADRRGSRWGKNARGRSEGEPASPGGAGTGKSRGKRPKRKIPTQGKTSRARVIVSGASLFPPAPGTAPPEELRRWAARAAFVEELLQDDRVKDLFRAWGERTGFATAWRSLDAVHQAQVEATPLGKRSRRLERQIAEAKAALQSAYRRWWRAPVRGEAEAFVRDRLRLPWLWVVEDLLIGFDSSYTSFKWPIPGGTFTPDTASAQFVGPSLGETEQEAFARLKREYLRVRGAVRATFARRASGGWRPSRSEETIARYARWVYRHRVLGESIRSLAREYHRQKGHVCSGDDRPTVRRGIAEAERRLTLAPPQG